MDVPELLSPLEHIDGPCGEDLSFSAEFDALQEARRADDPTLAQGEWVAEIKEADWIAVVRLSTDLLARRTKDLRVVAWFAEARCQCDGLAGLADGYKLLAGLCERFWNELHPLPEEDGGLDSRSGVLDWWLAQTVRLLREVPLSHSPKGVFSLVAREQARSHEEGPGGGSQGADAGRLGERLAMIDAAMRDTPRLHHLDCLSQIERLTTSMHGLRSFLDARMGGLAPTFSPCLDVLDDLARSLKPYLGAVAAGAAIDEAASRGLGGDAVTIQAQPYAGDGPREPVQTIRSRAQAIQQLELIAAYFRQTEPHSPVAYLADKAARWGRMPLHEWLRSVVKDEAVLCRMEELLGLEGQAVPVAD